MVKYEIGKTVRGSVTGITDYGIFVRLENFYSGLIHISEISDGFVSDINAVASIGDDIEAEIIDVDEENLQVKLSIKNIPKFKKRKYSRRKIKEVGTGFGLLGEKLKEWVNNYSK